jgi:hypothetical protein
MFRNVRSFTVVEYKYIILLLIVVLMENIANEKYC